MRSRKKQEKHRQRKEAQHQAKQAEYQAAQNKIPKINPCITDEHHAKATQLKAKNPFISAELITLLDEYKKVPSYKRNKDLYVDFNHYVIGVHGNREHSQKATNGPQKQGWNARILNTKNRRTGQPDTNHNWNRVVKEDGTVEFPSNSMTSDTHQTPKPTTPNGHWSYVVMYETIAYNNYNVSISEAYIKQGIGNHDHLWPGRYVFLANLEGKPEYRTSALPHFFIANKVDWVMLVGDHYYVNGILMYADNHSGRYFFQTPLTPLEFKIYLLWVKNIYTHYQLPLDNLVIELVVEKYSGLQYFDINGNNLTKEEQQKRFKVYHDAVTVESAHREAEELKAKSDDKPVVKQVPKVNEANQGVDADTLYNILLNLPANATNYVTSSASSLSSSVVSPAVKSLRNSIQAIKDYTVSLSTSISGSSNPASTRASRANSSSIPTHRKTTTSRLDDDNDNYADNAGSGNVSGSPSLKASLNELPASTSATTASTSTTTPTINSISLSVSSPSTTSYSTSSTNTTSSSSGSKFRTSYPNLKMFQSMEEDLVESHDESSVSSNETSGVSSPNPSNTNRFFSTQAQKSKPVSSHSSSENSEKINSNSDEEKAEKKHKKK